MLLLINVIMTSIIHYVRSRRDIWLAGGFATSGGAEGSGVADHSLQERFVCYLRGGRLAGIIYIYIYIYGLFASSSCKSELG